MFKSLPITPYRFRAEMSFLLRFFRVNSKGKNANFIMDTCTTTLLQARSVISALFAQEKYRDMIAMVYDDEGDPESCIVPVPNARCLDILSPHDVIDFFHEMNFGEEEFEAFRGTLAKLSFKDGRLTTV